VFKSVKHVFADYRGTLDRAFHVRDGIGKVKQPDLCDGQILSGRCDAQQLPRIS